MTEPFPMTPPDCDLRDFPHMQLDVLRLRDSDLASVPDAEVFRASVLSWCVAWHQIPAASLPDDDAALCRLLGYGRDVKGWQKVRAAGALHGYVKCSDGRLYHPVVAEKAFDAWQKKQAQRNRTEAARNARLSQRLSQTSPPLSQNANPLSQTASGLPQTKGRSVTHDVTGSKGEGEGEREEIISSLRSDSPPRRKQRIPPGWQPDAKGMQFAREHGMRNPLAELQRFRDFHIAKGNLFADIPAAWRTWCQNHARFGGNVERLPLVERTEANPNGQVPGHMPGAL